MPRPSSPINMPPENTPSGLDSTAGILREQLAGPLPVDRLMVEALPEMVERLQRELLALAGRPLGELVLNPATSIGALVTIKDYGKKLASRKTGQAEHDAALAIYFAAIARALVSHDQKISTHSHQNLARSFAILAGKPWMPAELIQLFQNARQVCEQMT